MMNPISPEFQYIIYKEREKELELAIERRLAREARGKVATPKQAGSWYLAVVHWLKGQPRRRTTCQSC